jgi:peptide/nickel transport system permease protein
LYRAYDALTFKFGRAVTLRSSTGSSLVVDIILEALPRTILLFTTATIITIIIGIILGMKSAVKVGSLFDRTISTFALFTYSLPMWWTGLLFILYFSYMLNIFPSGGIVSTPPPEGFAYYLDVLWHMALPTITIVFVNFGGWSYMTRSIVTNVMTEDFVITAKAKGVPERSILYGHVFRTASPPLVTSMVLSLIYSLSGAIITEAVFSWPGIGRLYWMAISSGDMPVVLGLVYITTFLYVFAVLILDFIYGLLDPRVKVGV